MTTQRQKMSASQQLFLGVTGENSPFEIGEILPCCLQRSIFGLFLSV